MLKRRSARKREKLTPMVVSLVTATLKAKGMEPCVGLDEPFNAEGLGLDSIELLELLQAVETTCKVHIPDRYWGNNRPQTINELLDIVAA